MTFNSLTPEEVAAALSITKNTVYAMVKRGELNAYRIGRKIRIDEMEVTGYKEKKRKTPNNSKGNCDPFFIICGQDIILDILAGYMERLNPGVKILRSYKDSYNGIYDLYNGRVNVTASHLWDGDTDTYNTSYVKYMMPGVPTEIIPLVRRFQGIYVKKGNPLAIKGLKDFGRTDISFINRECGSGTRVLLDEHLRLMGISALSIPGYETISTSHMSVATSISRGAADFGMGVGKVARQARGLEFIPLQQENYDMIVRVSDLRLPIIQSMLYIIRSEEYRNELLGLGGYGL